MFLTHLSCFSCSAEFPADRLRNLCDCGKPLQACYDLAAAGRAIAERGKADRPRSLWRYPEILPLPAGVPPLTLGEGGTPLLAADRLAERLHIKDEAVNPTGSFKARGMAVAVAMAKHLGARALAAPSAGNAGGALAAYAAAAGLEAHIFMPRDVPTANRLECELYGAKVTLVDGLIHDCGRLVAELAPREGWFDLSTLKEPYRVEGKKTMGYELFEDLGRLPEVILYPTGGGTGLIGMWKAFDEMEAMGWVSTERPRMVSVQAEGCAPIARAFDGGQEEAGTFQNAQTVAAGLRVPRAIADFVMLRILRESGGTAVTVSDTEMLAAARDMSAATGVCACPEGGACLVAYRRLAASGWIRPAETTVLFNTGTGLKYAEAWRG